MSHWTTVGDDVGIFKTSGPSCGDAMELESVFLHPELQGLKLLPAGCTTLRSVPVASWIIRLKRKRRSSTGNWDTDLRASADISSNALSLRPFPPDRRAPLLSGNR